MKWGMTAVYAREFCLWLTCSWLLCFWAVPGMAQTEVPVRDGRRVMVVHSYHKTQAGHEVEMTQGIDQAFAGGDAVLHHVYMDTKRYPDLAWKKKAGQMALEEMDAFNPEVVIALDDNAQAFFVKEAMARENAPMFVFGGVNAAPSVYGYTGKNVTGVLERPNVAESFDLLLKINPDIRQVVMLSDHSTTTDFFVNYCQTLDLPVTVVAYVQVSSLNEWKAAIDRYKNQVDAFGIYLLRTVRKETGKPVMVTEDELVAELNRRCDLPTVGFFDTAARAGILCGISVSMMEQGYEAGRIARALLEGSPMDAFPMQPTHRGRIQLNLIRAEQLGIKLNWKIISKADVVVR